MTWIDYFRKFKEDITEEEVDNILWEETCYPFNDETTMKQVETYFTQVITATKKLHNESKI